MSGQPHVLLSFRQRAGSAQQSPEVPRLKAKNGVSPPDQAVLRRRRQIHLWISESDYQSLRGLGEAEGEPMSRILRIWIRQLVRNAKIAGQAHAG